MKGMISLSIAAALFSSGAWAQQSTTTTATAPVAAGATTATTQQVKPEEAKKWGGAFTLQAMTDAVDQNDNGSKASILSVNVLSLSYKASKVESFGVAAQFWLNMVPDLDKRSTSIEDEMIKHKTRNGFKTEDPYLSYSRKNKGILGSGDIATLYRAYLPFIGENYSGTNLNNRRRGSLRLSAEVPWQINPNVTVALELDPRIYFREMESTLKAPVGVKASYNINDKLSPYFEADLVPVFGNANDGGSLWTGKLSQNNANFDYGLEWAPTRNMAFAFTYSSEFSLNEGAKPYNLDNSTYNLIFQISI